MNARRIVRAFAPTLRYWMQAEVHVYAFSIAANVLLSFFPFLIIAMSLARPVFGYTTTVAAIDFIFRDYLPGALGQFLHSEAHNNLPQGRPLQVVSLVLLLFTANGIFEPLEVTLNHVWGIRKNRSFFRNQLVSLALIFACGGLALLSFGVTALHHESPNASGVQAFVEDLFLKIAAVPLAALILFLIYRFLPNGRPPLNRVIPAAIGVGLLLEALKYVNILVWPRFEDKIAREYGVFRYSVCTATYLRLPVGQALGLRRPPRPPAPGGPRARRSAGRCPTLLSNTWPDFWKIWAWMDMSYQLFTAGFSGGSGL